MTDPAVTARVLDLAVAVQQIPAPTFGEAQRAAFVLQRFEAENLHQVGLHEPGNVYACLKGSGSALPVIVSAHLDTVFPFDTDLRVQREDDKIFGPGIGDNSLGVAGLFGVLWGLQAGGALPGDVWLVANVGEEGLGDLYGMKAVVEHFGGDVAGYVVLEGMALGRIYNRGLGVQRYRITATCQGGHSWVDYGRPSAIHHLARLVTRLDELKLPANGRSSLNVGVIAGGISINTIASEAHLELDLRSEEEATLQNIVKSVQNIVAAAERPDVHYHMELIGRRPAGSLAPSHRLVQIAQRSLEAQGYESVLGIGSTDANTPLSQGYPAVCVGLTTGFGAHTAHEFIHTPAVGRGLEQVIALVRGLFDA